MLGELETVLPQTLLVQYNDLGATVELHFAVPPVVAAAALGGNVVVVEICVDEGKVQVTAAK